MKKPFDSIAWDKKSYTVMLEGVRSKVEQHPEVRKVLMDSGDYTIVEDTHDHIWGCGVDGKGQNLLGKILMQVRDELKKIDSKIAKKSADALNHKALQWLAELGVREMDNNKIVALHNTVGVKVIELNDAAASANHGTKPRKRLPSPSREESSSKRRKISTNPIVAFAHELKERHEGVTFKYRCKTQKGYELKYGVNDNDHFYISGLGKDEITYYIHVNKGNVYENDIKTEESKWAEWAFPYVKKHYESINPKSPMQAVQPVHQINHQNMNALQLVYLQQQAHIQRQAYLQQVYMQQQAYLQNQMQLYAWASSQSISTTSHVSSFARCTPASRYDAANDSADSLYECSSNQSE